jgi:hypothetical protein
MDEVTRRERARQWLLDNYVWEAERVRDLVTVLDEVVEAERALIAEYIEGRLIEFRQQGNVSVHDALRTLAADIAAGRYVSRKEVKRGEADVPIRE